MWGTATLVVGGLFGWLTPGLQNRDRVLRLGLVLGVAVALVLAGLGALIGSPPLGIGTEPVDVASSVIGMAVLFVVGVWIGDIFQRHSAVTD